MACKAEVKPSYAENVMSVKLFKRLESGKFLFFCSNAKMRKTTVGNLTFIGEFTSKIEINRVNRLANFYIQDSDTDIVQINMITAKKLTLL